MTDLNETMVESFDDAEAADTLPDGVTEETDESEESLESLNEGENSEAGEPAEEKTQQAQKANEPGWIKGRIDKAVQKALAEQESRLTAQFQAQMKPLLEKALNDEARELVRQGEFKSLDRAKEYLQLKQGLPTQSKAEEQPRNQNGQFAPKGDPVMQAKIESLAKQADKVAEKTGLDVVGEFEKNPDIKKRVISGELDFYDVADMMKQAPKKKAPTPMRSPNGASGANRNAIDTMSDEAFHRMEKNIAEGKRYRLT
jgi:hypothetical protein